jgi:hypothetical protein
MNMNNEPCGTSLEQCPFDKEEHMKYHNEQIRLMMEGRHKANKMIVYMLAWCNNADYDEGYTVGVFTTKDKAKLAAESDSILASLVWDDNDRAAAPTKWWPKADYSIDTITLDEII